MRVARYNGQGLPWTSVGTMNNHPELTMRHPSATNAPVIGVSLSGSAVVVWQEPNAAGVAQIFARRIFPGRLGNPLQVSPESAGGRTISAEADAPALAVNRFGEARIAYRLAGGAGSPYGAAQIFLDSLPSEVDKQGAKLTGARPVASAPTLAPPSVAIDEAGDYRLGYASGRGRPALVSGDDFHPSSAPAVLGRLASTAEAGGAEEREPTAINPAGGGVTIWRGTSATGAPVVEAREDFAHGAWQLAELSSPISGSLGEPVLGGSSQGDALIAFAQGPPGEKQVMAAVAKSPPGEFIATAPIGWVTRGFGDGHLGSARRGVRQHHLRGARRWPRQGARAHWPVRAPGLARPRRRHPPRAGAGHRQPRPADDDPGGGTQGRRQPAGSRRAQARRPAGAGQDHRPRLGRGRLAARR